MNKPVGLELIVYSLVVAGLSCLAHRMDPALAESTRITGLVGGGLCLLWGIGAMLGNQSKVPVVLTLAPISFLMFAQTLLALGGGGRKLAPDRTVAAVTGLLLVLSIVMLLRIAYVGLPLRDQTPPDSKEDSRSRTSNDHGTGGAG